MPIGAAGGTLVSKDGTVRLEIPAGAISATRSITLDELSPNALGPAFAGKDVQASFDMGPGGTTFDKPVTVTIRTAQRATLTDSTTEVRGQMLLTVENGTAVPLDNVIVSVVGDTVLVSGQTTHFSPLVLTAETYAVSAKVSNIPDAAEVDRPFDAALLVTVTSDIAPPTLIGATYFDNPTRVVAAIPSGGAPFAAQNNHIEGTIAYTCPSAGAASVRPTVLVALQLNALSTAGAIQWGLEFGSRPRHLDCVPRTAALQIEFRGDGSGRVDGGPTPAFSCDASCTQRLLEGSTAELTAVPDEDSRFAGFSGQCGNSDVPGVVEPLRMAGDRLCIVTFSKRSTHTVSVTQSGQGNGNVQVNGTDCAEGCVIQVPDGASVELRATPDAGSRFAFWGPNCPTPTPNEPIIVFTPNGPVSCDAVFPLEQMKITVAPGEAVLDVGAVQRLNVVITDETGTLERDVTFTSGIPSIASVDAEGNVTALAPGTAAIAASVAGPGGGVAYSFITVRQTLFGLTVRKTGSGTGTTSIYNTGNGESTNFCDLDCPGLTARLAQGSILHVFASPGQGSTFVRFLDDCVADSGRPTVGVVNLTEAKTCTVEFGTSGPLSIAFGGLTSKTTGLPVSVGNVNGTVYAEYDAENLPGNWGTLDVGTSIDDVPSGTCLPPSLGGRIRCEVNTAAADSLFPVRGLKSGKFRNGLRSLKLRARTQSGDPVVTVEQPVTLANPNRLTITTNNPPGATSSTVRGGRIELRVALDVFDDIAAENLQVLLNPGPPPLGSGPLVFNAGPSDDPFLFTTEPSSSPNAQGSFTATPMVLDGGGDDITELFDLPPLWQQVVDMVPPNVPSFFMPPSTPISRGVLILDFQTGPYAAGTRIPVDRISGGFVVGAHLPFCGSAHYHGTISIRQASSSAFDGPFADPRNGADCGHGILGAEDLDNAFFSFGGTVTDASPIATRVEMLQGLNGCDDVDLFDDIPFPQGNGPGQSPNPFFESTSNPFTAMFDLNLEPSMAGQDVCFRIVVFDSAVGPDGLPVNGVTRVLETRLDPFIPPPPQ